MMRTLASSSLVCLLVTPALLTPALAQKGPSVPSAANPVLGVTLDEFSDTGPNTLSFMGVTAHIEGRPGDEDATVPVFAIEAEGAEVLRFDGEPSYFSFLPVSLRIANIDPTTDTPEVIATSYTGGAHCCERVQIAAQQPDGTWMVHELGLFDGGYGLVDADENGFAEIEVADQSFLYTFDCYACSAPPPRIYTIADGAPVDMSSNPDLFAFYQGQMVQFDDPSAMLDQPGRLAGWAGLEARLGRGEAAITTLAQLNAAPDSVYEACSTGGALWQCDEADKVQMDFIAFLRNHLIEHGYMSGGSSNPNPGRKG